MLQTSLTKSEAIKSDTAAQQMEICFDPQSQNKIRKSPLVYLNRLRLA
jgi:hypothetical protein